MKSEIWNLELGIKNRDTGELELTVWPAVGSSFASLSSCLSRRIEMAPTRSNRREFIRDLGIGAAAVPFVLNLPSLGFANQQRRKQRLVVMFSPNGVFPPNFWPTEEGANYTLKESLTPLEPFQDKTLILHGVCDRVRGDGDAHMRGIGCLLTGIELFPGNIQGGSHTPAGWASGISIDQ